MVAVLSIVLALGVCTSTVAAATCTPHAWCASNTCNWEWGGTFDTPETIYTWLAQKVTPDADANGVVGNPSYGEDAYMDFVVMDAGASYEFTDDNLLTGNTKIATNCSANVKTQAAMITADEITAGTCVRLTFDQNAYQTYWFINTTGVDKVVMFAEHLPIEFEENKHYMCDVYGADVEPVEEVEASTCVTENDKPWEKVIATCFLVALCTFSGVVLAVPAFGNLRSKFTDEFEAVAAAFAAGAILSTAFYLVLFEATHLIAAFIPEGGDEVEATWRWGTAVLGGFSLPFFTEAVRKAVMPGERSTVAPTDVEKGSDSVSRQSKYRVMASVLIGDFMHNVVDGILIATAFYLCNDTKGWAVVSATIGHEIAQEISDYILLTSDLVKLSIPKALLFNFISGLSVVVGGIAMLESNPNNKEQGIIMAFGGGTYVAIGASECLPRVFAKATTAKTMWLCVLSFVVGVVAIALVLLDHQHCIPEGGDGHGH